MKLAYAQLVNSSAGARVRPPIDRNAARDAELYSTARGFLIFAIASIVVFAPNFLSQDRTWNYLIYMAAVLALAGFAIIRGAERGSGGAALARFRALLSAQECVGGAVFIAFLAFYAVTMYPPSPFNEQVRQAVALVHGHTYIDAPQSFLEHVQIGQYSYALHPPLPAIMLMPFAAIWGMNTNQTEFSVVVGAVATALAWIMLGRLRLSLNPRVWLTVFFGIGNVLWYETTLGTTWALPMNTSVVFTMLALIELFGEARPLWVGIWAAIATLGRYDLALAAPVYAILLLAKGRTIPEILEMIPGYLAVGVIFIGLNEARFGSFFDQGVMLTGPKGAPVFSPRYLPGNLYTVLFMAPTVNSNFPYIHPVFSGQAIALTSPAFVLAFRASFKRLTVAMMWLAAVLVSIPSLLCYANGFAQFGTRHYIPAFPFLLVMMAIGMPRRTDQLTKILICASIFLVGFGIWQIHIWGLNGP
ncbi:MAG: hypothetical protein ACYDC3_04325 [Candidatus Binataceae bacterium]